MIAANFTSFGIKFLEHDFPVFDQSESLPVDFFQFFLPERFKKISNILLQAFELLKQKKKFKVEEFKVYSVPITVSSVEKVLYHAQDSQMQSCQEFIEDGLDPIYIQEHKKFLAFDMLNRNCQQNEDLEKILFQVSYDFCYDQKETVKQYLITVVDVGIYRRMLKVSYFFMKFMEIKLEISALLKIKIPD